MSKVIEGIPEFFTQEQYIGLFKAAGVEDPKQVVEFRMAYDGIHVVLFATDADGNRILDLQSKAGQGGRMTHQKHRIFIPVRREVGDTRTAKVSEVGA